MPPVIKLKFRNNAAGCAAKNEGLFSERAQITAERCQSSDSRTQVRYV
jgi:hypothetical protein